VPRYGRLWRLYRRLRRAGRKKRDAELAYWRARRAEEGRLGNEHFEALFTGVVGLDAGFYRGKAVLDIGCGPRGSLEWATEASRRVGLDPLAREYRGLGTDEHAMEYVAGRSEEMPFDDAEFDVVTSLNSLDHVDDLGRTAAEIKRVTRPGGHFVLAVEIGHRPTWTEPHSLSWDVCALFEPEFEVVERSEYERGGGSLYDPARRRERFDHADDTPRPGVLAAVLRRSNPRTAPRVGPGGRPPPRRASR
jgi:SAM-dependent methyltransferase